MSDPETKDKHSQRRKRNFYAKILRDSGDFKGAFSIKVFDPRKGGEYKRKRINPRDLGDIEENE